MAFIQGIRNPEWVATVHKDTGQPDKPFVCVPTEVELIDPSGHMPPMRLPLNLMIEKDGMHALVHLIIKFFDEQPNAPEIKPLPGQN